jgi:hypothetical protein
MRMKKQTGRMKNISAKHAQTKAFKRLSQFQKSPPSDRKKEEAKRKIREMFFVSLFRS